MDYMAAYELEKLRNEKLLEKYNRVLDENRAMKQKLQKIKDFADSYDG